MRKGPGAEKKGLVGILAAGTADMPAAEEARVLGSLVEKSVTTPEYYPLSLNALKNACNQKSNREPVMDLDEVQVSQALLELIRRQMAYEVAGSRAQKYGQNFTVLNKLVGGETAAFHRQSE